MKMPDDFQLLTLTQLETMDIEQLMNAPVPAAYDFSVQRYNTSHKKRWGVFLSRGGWFSVHWDDDLRTALLKMFKHLNNGDPS